MANQHTHSYWLDFESDKVRCSKFGCTHSVSPAKALVESWNELSLEVAQGRLKGHTGKVYILKLNGEYLCTITGYTTGVLHLLDFAKQELFEVFKESVSSCFGVNHIQLKKEVVYER